MKKIALVATLAVLIPAPARADTLLDLQTQIAVVKARIQKREQQIVVLTAQLAAMQINVPPVASPPPGTGSAPVANDSVANGVDGGDPALAYIDDVTSAYDNMGKNLELMYNLLIQNAKDKALLESKVKELQEAIKRAASFPFRLR